MPMSGYISTAAEVAKALRELRISELTVSSRGIRLCRAVNRKAFWVGLFKKVLYICVTLSLSVQFVVMLWLLALGVMPTDWGTTGVAGAIFVAPLASVQLCLGIRREFATTVSPFLEYMAHRVARAGSSHGSSAASAWAAEYFEDRAHCHPSKAGLVLAATTYPFHLAVFRIRLSVALGFSAFRRRS